MSVCPNCNALVEDFDGFGVLIHEACGYCSHPDSYGGVCRSCGLSVRPETAEKRVAAIRERAMLAWDDGNREVMAEALGDIVTLADGRAARDP